MIRSYFKTGWRNLWRGKLYSAINIVGLTFGIACFLLIGLYVFDEVTFDNQHTRADRIYRVINHRNENGEASTIAAASYKVAEEGPNAIPEIELTTRMSRPGRANLVDPENPVPFQETVTIADENFLRIFDFPLISGDPQTALKEPASIVIDENLAMRIFKTTDVVGKMVQFSYMQIPVRVTGVMKPHSKNSSFTFNSLMSESTFHSAEYFKDTMANDWTSLEFSVYALLRDNASPASVAGKMVELVESNSTPEEGVSFYFSLQALPDVHLKSEGIVDGARNTNVDSIAQGNPIYITIFSFTAVFVLLIAGINYTNLTTARASNRIKEIGVRKAIGAMRSSLIGQFLIESFLTTTISFILAIGVVLLLLPSFNAFVNKELALNFIGRQNYWLPVIGFVVLMIFLSGSYAALLLSRMKPVALLKGEKMQRRGDLTVRKGLVVFQFMISTVMIVGTIILLLQVDFLNNTQLGFNKDLMVVIDVNTGKARSSFEIIKSEMEKVPSVKHVSVTSRVPGEWKTIRRIKARPDGSTDASSASYVIGADKDFLATYEIILLKGRNFDTKADSLGVILNESAAKMFNITEPSGQLIEVTDLARGDESFTSLDKPIKPRVLGIVKDFHFQSLRDKIQPLILAYNNNPFHGIDYYSVRIEPVNIQATLDQLKAIMVRIDEREPFEYHFLDDQLALFYVEDHRRQSLLTWVALSSIFIACLGLFGLATYSTEQRVKEIGVRKVLGASVLGLAGLVSRDFVKLVLIANVLALPLAWWGSNKWLQEYAYHIEPGWEVFLGAAVTTIGIALVTVSQQALKAARANPVNSLRSE